MKKLRIVLEVDPLITFDMLRLMKGNCEPLGERVAGIAMTGKSNFADQIGLACYGITVASVDVIDRSNDAAVSA